jgi:hypothetical protein
LGYSVSGFQFVGVGAWLRRHHQQLAGDLREFRASASTFQRSFQWGVD